MSFIAFLIASISLSILLALYIHKLAQEWDRTTVIILSMMAAGLVPVFLDVTAFELWLMLTLGFFICITIIRSLADWVCKRDKRETTFIQQQNQINNLLKEYDE